MYDNNTYITCQPTGECCRLDGRCLCFDWAAITKIPNSLESIFMWFDSGSWEIYLESLYYMYFVGRFYLINDCKKHVIGSTCNLWEFSCMDGSQCLPNDMFCDGIVQCMCVYRQSYIIETIYIGAVGNKLVTSAHREPFGFSYGQEHWRDDMGGAETLWGSLEFSVTWNSSKWFFAYLINKIQNCYFYELSRICTLKFN